MSAVDPAAFRALQQRVQALEDVLSAQEVWREEQIRRAVAKVLAELTGAVPLDVEDPYWGDGPGPATVAMRRSLAASVAAGHEVLTDDEAWLLDRPPPRRARSAPVDVAAAAQSLDAINARQEAT